MFSKICRSANKYINLTNKSKKFFDIHEYQSKAIMREFGVRVQKGDIALNSNDAAKVASGLDPTGGLILKSQIHAGGRGKGTLSSGLKGGVKICKTPEEVKGFADQMLGFNLVTHQTTKAGLPVNAVLVHEGVDIVREIYLAFVLDRTNGCPSLIASKYGGMEIEEVAKEHPDDIFVKSIDINQGLSDADARDVAVKLDLGHVADDAVQQMQNLYKMFVALDATQIEINPWATDPKDLLFCIDAKLNIDDNAKFRQPDLVKQRSESVASEQTDEHEDKAIAAGLNYVALDGNIGCMVNGAGLAMATMDIIKQNGGEPANFLDVGGGANVEQIIAAFDILNKHPDVKAILINIFGGILKCDMLADGIIQAAEYVHLDTPLCVRLSGTNSDIGLKKLKEFSEKNPKIKISVAADLDEAAQQAVKLI